MPFAIQREPDRVNWINVEQRRQPVRNLLCHPRQFRLGQREWNPRDVQVKRRADDALLARDPDGGTSPAVADGRGERRAAGGGIFRQHARDKMMQPQRAAFLLVPPAPAEQDRRAFVRGSRSVFQSVSYTHLTLPTNREV